MSEVRGGGQDKLPHAGGQGTAKRSHHRPGVRSGSSEELPPARGQGPQPRGATTGPRSGAAAERSYHRPEVRSGS